MPSHIRQADNHAIKTAEGAEAHQHATIGTINSGGTIGRNAHQTLGTGQRAIKALAGPFDPGMDPFIRPTHKIGGKHSQYRLNQNTGWTPPLPFVNLAATAPVLYFEREILI